MSWEPVGVGSQQACTIRNAKDALDFIESKWRSLPVKERNAAYIHVFSAVTGLGPQEQARTAFVALICAMR
ncbi:DUF982 domain-containing protein [Falsirhodobacter deserti]|uniref:DUF982 domain-containing protein n=1 Tax=Falsirhodobacter deserti TaxID=1365611 RepID=UPI000FE417DC